MRPLEQYRKTLELEQAYGERSGLLIYLNVEPVFDGLRADPRFADLLRRVHLPSTPSEGNEP